MLVRDYFDDNPVYDEEMFRRRFRMSKRLFTRIVDDLEEEYTFFKWAWDARGRKGFSPIQKCTSAIRQLAYRTTADSIDEYLRMSEKTSRDCIYNFCEGIIHLYIIKYLRKPTLDDIQILYAAHETKHGFSGMLGIIDCTHWAWHAFFGVAGSINDINVLNQSPIFNDLYENKAPDSSFEVNGVEYKHGYYLADGIYPDWSTFVKSFTYPQDDKRKKFKSRQESAKKDVERAFGVLKQHWHIIHNPARPWTPERLRNIMCACIILHNMILEDEGNAVYNFDDDDLITDDLETHISEEQRAENVRQIKNRETHINLRSDLVEHIWSIQHTGDGDD